MTERRKRSTPERKLTVSGPTSPAVLFGETLIKVIRLRGYDVPAWLLEAMQETLRLLRVEADRKKRESAKRSLRRAGDLGDLYC